MIIIRTLRKDIANYNKEDDIVRGLGWGGHMHTCMREITVNLKGIEKKKKYSLFLKVIGV